MKKRKINKNILKSLIFRLACLAFVLALPLAGTTNALLFDQEQSNTNLFSASSLDFSLRGTDDVLLVSPLFEVENLKPTDVKSESVRVTKDGSLDFIYDIGAQKTGGDEAFCNALNIEAKLEGTSQYNGALLGLNITPTLISSLGKDNWEFILSLNSSDSALQEKTCEFNLVFKGWQTDSDGSWGFTDEEVLGNIVSSGDWTAPYVKIESPADSVTVFGIVDILGTVTDNNPHHYWLAAENAATHQQVSGFPGTVNEGTSFDHRLLYQWDTTKVPDGNYIIKLEARDAAGNKNPNQAPVIVDPENALDSVDWISITVINTQFPPALPPTGGGVVINEVYYDVDEGHGSESDNEWVELYNNSDQPVSLKNWSLSDGQGHTKNINTNVSIPGKGFAVLSNNSSTWTQHWSLPSEAVRINWAGGSYWLNNDGDKLVLKDSNGNEMDMVAWENFVSGWNLNASEGKSIARIVKGVDTDSVNDWHVLDIPNPGTNPHPPKTEPTTEFTLRSDKRAVSFRVENIKEFKTVSYEITYDAKPEAKQIAGTVDLKNEDSFVRENLLLGTCSTTEGKVCVYDWGMTKITLRVVLTLPNGQTTEIIKEIAY